MEKFKKFLSLQELGNFLDEERTKWSQWVVRFIHAETESDWINLVQLLRDFAQTWSLSRYCCEDDLWPDLSLLLGELASIQQNVLLIPLPAHLRMLKRTMSNAFLEELVRVIPKAEPEKRGKLRIYVPLYGALDQISRLVAGDQRLGDACLSLESTEGASTQSSKVTVVSKELPISPVFFDEEGWIVRQSYKEYLEYWENFPSPGKRIFLFTELAGSSGHPFGEGVEVLVKPFEALEALCPEWRRYGISEDWGPNEYWRELLSWFYSKGRFRSKGLMKNLHNILEISPNEEKPEAVLSQWSTSTPFKKWLLLVWLFLKQNKGYLALVFQGGFPNTKQFEERLATAVFLIESPAKNPQYWECYQERKRYLQAMGITKLPSSFWEELEKQKESSVARLRYLTDRTREEKEKVVDLVGTALRKGVPLQEILGTLSKVYPGLFWYLAWEAVCDSISSSQVDLQSYFSEYVQQKIADLVKPDFVERVRTVAEAKGVWWQDFQPTKHIVDQLYQDGQTLLYWIDSLGLEYLGYLAGLLAQKEELTYAIHIGYALLPTTTEYNKAFLEGKIVQEFRQLDELKHSNQYSYPESIVDELDLLQKALDEAVSRLDDYKKVLIVSDHGASRLAVLSSKNNLGLSYPPKPDARVKKYGRYCVDEKHSYSSEIPTCIDFGVYHVFADYGRFAVSGGNVGEIHGGATLEEVLVPIIEVQKRVELSRAMHPQVKLESTLVKLKPGTKPKIRFEISPEVTGNVVVQVEGKNYPCFQEGSFWAFEIETKQPLVQGVVIVGGREVGRIAVHIQRGILEHDDL